MAQKKMPQREMLRRLLESGKLSSSESQAVRRAHEDLASGRIGGLNLEQNAWAEQLCQKCGIVVDRPSRASNKKKEKEKQASLLVEFDALPRPKKPPGRP